MLAAVPVARALPLQGPSLHPSPAKYARAEVMPIYQDPVFCLPHLSRIQLKSVADFPDFFKKLWRFKIVFFIILCVRVVMTIWANSDINEASY